MGGFSFIYFSATRVNVTLSNFNVKNVTFTQGQSLVNVFSPTIAEVPGQLTGVTVANWTLQNVYDTTAIIYPAQLMGVIYVGGTSGIIISNVTANNLQLTSKTYLSLFFLTTHFLSSQLHSLQTLYRHFFQIFYNKSASKHL